MLQWLSLWEITPSSFLILSSDKMINENLHLPRQRMQLSAAFAKFRVNLLLLPFAGEDWHLFFCFVLKGRARISNIRRVLSLKSRTQPGVKCLNLECDQDLRQPCLQLLAVISINVLSRLLAQTWKHKPVQGPYNQGLRTAPVKASLSVKISFVYTTFFFSPSHNILLSTHKKKRKKNIPPD